MSKLKLGINEVGNEVYHSDREYFSSSVLKTLLEDKKKFYKKYILGEPEKMFNQAALDLGTYVHALCLEPQTVSKEFAVYTGRKAGAAWDKFQLENEGKMILGSLQSDQADSLVKAFKESELSTSLVSVGKAELTLALEMEGAKIKVRADFIDPERGIIVDLKTTAKTLNLKEIQKTVAGFHYDLSAALYVDAFSQHYEKPFEFYFIFLSKADFTCKVVKASVELINNGRKKYKKALRTYKTSIENNDWLDEELILLQPASWDKMGEDMTRESAEERLNDLKFAVDQTLVLIKSGSGGMTSIYEDALKYYNKEISRIEELISNGEI